MDEPPDFSWNERKKQITLVFYLYSSFSNDEELFQALSEQEIDIFRPGLADEAYGNPFFPVEGCVGKVECEIRSKRPFLQICSTERIQDAAAVLGVDKLARSLQQTSVGKTPVAVFPGNAFQKPAAVPLWIHAHNGVEGSLEKRKQFIVFSGFCEHNNTLGDADNSAAG